MCLREIVRSALYAVFYARPLITSKSRRHSQERWRTKPRNKNKNENRARRRRKKILIIREARTVCYVTDAAVACWVFDAIRWWSWCFNFLSLCLSFEKGWDEYRKQKSAPPKMRMPVEFAWTIMLERRVYGWQKSSVDVRHHWRVRFFFFCHRQFLRFHFIDIIWNYFGFLLY